MSKLALALLVGFSLMATPAGLVAKGGGSGGGSTKPVSIRYVGVITSMVVTDSGVLVTVGTSYYNVGTALVTADTRIKLNGLSNAAITDIAIGDTAQIDLLWPSRTATKMEVIGVR